jgi:hypothetical protein
MTPDRRTVLELLLASVSSTVFGGASVSDPAIAATAATSSIPMTVTEQLMYSTVRIFYPSGWGTGFIFYFFRTADNDLRRHQQAGRRGRPSQDRCSRTRRRKMVENDPEGVAFEFEVVQWTASAGRAIMTMLLIVAFTLLWNLLCHQSPRQSWAFPSA